MSGTNHSTYAGHRRPGLWLAGIFALLMTALPDGHNDWKEGGFRGKVKVMDTYIYRDLAIGRNGAIADTSAWSTRTVYEFDSTGHFIRIAVTQRRPEIGLYLTTTRWYNSDLPNRSGYAVDEEGVVTDSIHYRWTGPYSYELEEFRLSDSTRVTFTSQLNAEYREVSGSQRIMRRDSVIDHSVFYNEFDTDGRLSKRIARDSLNHSTSFVIFEALTFDRKGNPLHSLQRDGNSGKIIRVYRRRVEYFEE